MLPGDPLCGVVITSRQRLDGLVAYEGARVISLQILTDGDARDLIADLIGRGRMAAEPEAASNLVALCGRLPLALRIAAALLAADPLRTLAEFVDELRSEGRLGSLSLSGDVTASVRAALAASYRRLPQSHRRLRRLALTAADDHTPESAAALADLPVSEARAVLRALSALHLLAPTGSDRFALHDLVDEYARERVRQDESEPDRHAAQIRVTAWYVHGARAAAAAIDPHTPQLPLPAGFPPAPTASAVVDRVGAQSWFDAERANLLATARAAAEHGPQPVAWLLADAMRGYLFHRCEDLDWQSVAGYALDAAVQTGDGGGLAAAYLCAGARNMARGEIAEAVERLTRAGQHSIRIGWLDAVASTDGNLGTAFIQMGRFDLAECTSPGRWTEPTAPIRSPARWLCWPAWSWCRPERRAAPGGGLRAGHRAGRRRRARRLLV